MTATSGLRAFDGISLADFTTKVTKFLEAAAPRARPGRPDWGSGPDEVSAFPPRTPQQELADHLVAKDWKRRESRAGLSWITGPPQYGGSGLPLSYESAYRELKADFVTPSENSLILGLEMVGPTILAHGSEELRQQFLPAIYRGDVAACQLFSEPDAGSDLASLRTSAVRRGDSWIVSGQKVWTSGAHLSDVGELLVRTDPAAPKHRGITALLVDLEAPGIEIRPLRQMTGEAHFNEVFFHEVAVPDARRLGKVNDGWMVATTTLMNERAALGAGGDAQLRLVWMLVGAAEQTGRIGDPLIRSRLAGLYTDVRVAQAVSADARENVLSGSKPGPELSVGKLLRSRITEEISALAADIIGLHLTADTGAWGMYSWSRFLLASPSAHIAGGTDDIQRSIVGERVLGLPREPRTREKAGP